MLPILLGVFLIWYSLSKISLTGLLQHFKEANYWYILLGVIFGLLSHFSRAYRWLFMLEPMGYKVKLGNSIMAVFAAYLINYTIPRAGEVARATILTNYENVPFQKGFGTIVAERVADYDVSEYPGLTQHRLLRKSNKAASPMCGKAVCAKAKRVKLLYHFPKVIRK